MPPIPSSPQREILPSNASHSEREAWLIAQAKRFAALYPEARFIWIRFGDKRPDGSYSKPPCGGKNWIDRATTAGNLPPMPPTASGIALVIADDSGAEILDEDFDGITAESHLAVFAPIGDASPPSVRFGSGLPGHYHRLYLIPPEWRNRLRQRVFGSKADGNLLELRARTGPSYVAIAAVGEDPAQQIGYHDGFTPEEIGALHPAPDWLLSYLTEPEPEERGARGEGEEPNYSHQSAQSKRKNAKPDRDPQGSFDPWAAEGESPPSSSSPGTAKQQKPGTASNGSVPPVSLLRLVPLSIRQEIERGTAEGSRNDTSAGLALALLGAESWCQSHGYPYCDSPWELLLDWAGRSLDRDGEPYPEEELEATYRGCYRRSPLPPEGVEGRYADFLRLEQQEAARRAVSGDRHRGAVSSSGPQPWGEPLPLPKAQTVELPEMGLDCLPRVLGPWLLDCAHSLNAPLENAAVAAISVASSLLGARCVIRPKIHDNEYELVPTIWCALVGEPSLMKKSPSLARVKKPLDLLNAAAAAERKAQMASYASKRRVWELELKAAEQQLMQALKAGDAGAKRDCESRVDALSYQEPEEPPLKVYSTNDSSIEALQNLLVANPQGLLVIRDELAGLLQSFERKGNEDAAPFYLEAYNGKGDYTVDRIGRGHLYIPRLCLTLIGTTQPERLQTWLAARREKVGNDGLLQRFHLLSFPERRPYQFVDQPVDEAQRQLALDTLVALAQTDPLKLGAREGEGGGLPWFRLSPDAYALYQAADHELLGPNGWVEEASRAGDGMLAQHFGKFDAFLLKLATLYHCLDVTAGLEPPGDVSAEAMGRAIAMLEVQKAHAQKVYGLANTATLAVNSLAKAITEGALEQPFTLRAVKRLHRASLKEEPAIRGAIEDLIDLGWLRELPATPKTGRPSTQWEVNPSLQIKS